MENLDDMLAKDYEVPKEIEDLAESISGGWWNHRLIEKETRWKDTDGIEHIDKYYEIHEVYYNKDGKPWSWTERPMTIYLEDRSDAKWIIKNLKKAYKRTILKETTLEDGDTELVDTKKYIKDIKPGW